MLRLTNLPRRFLRDRRAVAATEFALVLPLMLTLSLGGTAITLAVMANRKADMVARTLADLVARQPQGTPVTDAQINSMLTAGTAVLSPFSASPLKVTISSVEFVTDSGAATGYDAKPRWSLVSNGGTLRPCKILTSVANGTPPSATSLPVGLYGQGSVIIADIGYTYTPLFASSGFSTLYGLASLFTWQHSAYMRPRMTGSPLAYSGSLATVCPTY